MSPSPAHCKARMFLISFILIIFNRESLYTWRRVRINMAKGIHREIFSVSWLNDKKLFFNYTFPIDLTLIGILFGAKSIEKNVITIKIQFDWISLCVKYGMHTYKSNIFNIVHNLLQRSLRSLLLVFELLLYY